MPPITSLSVGATGAGVPSPSSAKRAKAQQHGGRGDDEDAAGRDEARHGGPRQAPAITEQPGNKSGDHARCCNQENAAAGNRGKATHWLFLALAASELNGRCLFPGHQAVFAIWEQNRPRMTFS